jgi:hypothetical protein
MDEDRTGGIFVVLVVYLLAVALLVGAFVYKHFVVGWVGW